MALGNHRGPVDVIGAGEIRRALETVDAAWNACLDCGISLDAIVSACILRILNEIAVEGGRPAVSLLLEVLRRDVERGPSRSLYLGGYDGAKEALDLALRPGGAA